MKVLSLFLFAMSTHAVAVDQLRIRISCEETRCEIGDVPIYQPICDITLEGRNGELYEADRKVRFTTGNRIWDRPQWRRECSKGLEMLMSFELERLTFTQGSTLEREYSMDTNPTSSAICDCYLMREEWHCGPNRDLQLELLGWNTRLSTSSTEFDTLRWSVRHGVRFRAENFCERSVAMLEDLDGLLFQRVD